MLTEKAVKEKLERETTRESHENEKTEQRTITMDELRNAVQKIKRCAIQRFQVMMRLRFKS